MPPHAPGRKSRLTPDRGSGPPHSAQRGVKGPLNRRPAAGVNHRGVRGVPRFQLPPSRSSDLPASCLRLKFRPSANFPPPTSVRPPRYCSPPSCGTGTFVCPSHAHAHVMHMHMHMCGKLRKQEEVPGYLEIRSPPEQAGSDGTRVSLAWHESWAGSSAAVP